jgi:hypothetical protein
LAVGERDRPGVSSAGLAAGGGRISETTWTARLMLGAAAPEMSAMSGLRGQSGMQTLIIFESRRKVDSASLSVHVLRLSARRRETVNGSAGLSEPAAPSGGWILGVNWTAPGGGSARSRLENPADG